MQFTPKSEKEVQEENLWQRGEYDFEVFKAEEKVSKAGNDMIELKIHIYNDEGRQRIINDYLMEKEGFNYKIRHAAFACGLGDKYETGELRDFDFEGRKGRCKVGIQKGKDGHPDKNVINDYIVAKDDVVNTGAPVDLPDDDMPF